MITADEARKILAAASEALAHESHVDRVIKDALTRCASTARYNLPHGEDDYRVAEALANRYRAAGWLVKIECCDAGYGEADKCWLEISLPVEARSA